MKPKPTASRPARGSGRQKAVSTLTLVEAVPQLYVRYHHAIVETVESFIPIASVLSIDEMICQLTGSQREIDAAVALAQRIKHALAERVGSACAAPSEWH